MTARQTSSAGGKLPGNKYISFFMGQGPPKTCHCRFVGPQHIAIWLVSLRTAGSLYGFQGVQKTRKIEFSLKAVSLVPLNPARCVDVIENPEASVNRAAAEGSTQG